MTFSILALSIECSYAECRDYYNFILSVIMLNVIILSVIMLSVVAPLYISILVWALYSLGIIIMNLPISILCFMKLLPGMIDSVPKIFLKRDELERSDTETPFAGPVWALSQISLLTFTVTIYECWH